MGTRVTTKGQVTIPAPIREAAQARAGTELEWSYDPIGERIVATKRRAEVKPGKSRFAPLRGTATAGMTTNEVMALMRDVSTT
jgi:AbrB family looped-hinge helix DNA binding protein